MCVCVCVCGWTYEQKHVSTIMLGIELKTMLSRSSKYSSLMAFILRGEQHGLADVLNCQTCVWGYLGINANLHSPAQ